MKLKPTCYLLAAALLCGCAVVHQPTSMTPVAAESRLTLAVAVPLRLETGYERTLMQGSQWTRVGQVPQGDVLRPYKHVLTVEGSHIHEAWLVVKDGKLVGFYLPAEGAFSPQKPVPLSFNP
ncbi:hypothetical protein [Pseudoduganella sp.]|uniref:hypothetical protein n=1 Tax=Pseudoduganella sp. TaxID=1880898 RepID=UPI0035B2C10A